MGSVVGFFAICRTTHPCARLFVWVRVARAGVLRDVLHFVADTQQAAESEPLAASQRHHTQDADRSLHGFSYSLPILMHFFPQMVPSARVAPQHM